VSPCFASKGREARKAHGKKAGHVGSSPKEVRSSSSGGRHKIKKRGSRDYLIDLNPYFLNAQQLKG